jgi:hypothetical protein
LINVWDRANAKLPSMEAFVSIGMIKFHHKNLILITFHFLFEENFSLGCAIRCILEYIPFYAAALLSQLQTVTIAFRKSISTKQRYRKFI